MKSNFWKYAALLAIGIMMISSCGKPAPEQKDPDPVFPTETINKTVAAGESVNININPNLAWEVSISGDGSGNYFWLDDAGMKATKISGKDAGSVTVTVEFSKDEEFDINRVCDVTLTMAGQSKKIATITRPSLGRTFELYAGVAGEFEFTEDFGTEKVTEASLVTFAGVTEYTLPVRVVTNYSWNVALPSWLKAYDVDGKEEINAGSEGTTDLLLKAVLSDDVMKGAQDKVRFIDSVNSSAVNELSVSLPEFASRLEYEINSMEFNIPGQVLMPNGSFVEGTAVAYILAAKGATVKALEWKGEYHDTKYAEWVNVEFGEYDADQGPLQYIDVAISVTENPGETRYADLFIFPVSMGDVKAEDICNFNDPACGFNAKYEKYYVGRIKQAGVVPPYIIPASSEELRNEVGTYFSVLEPKADNNILQWDFPDAQTYHKITYTDQWSADEGSFNCSKQFAYVKLFEDIEYPAGTFTKELAETDDCWISFVSFGEPANMQGRFNMNYVPQSPVHTAAVFYDAAGNMLSAVLVEYDPASTGGDGSELPVKITTGNGEISRMDETTELYEAVYGGFSVTDVYQIITNDKMLYVETPVDYCGYLRYDTKSFADYAGPISLEGASPNFYIYTGGGTEKSDVLYVFQEPASDGVSMLNAFAVHVIYDPSADIEVEAPFSFVNPELVGSLATLEPYSGPYADAIIAEWGAAQAPKTYYLLTYKDPSASSVAAVNVPAAPQDGAAWGNYPYSAGYWLQCELKGTQMTVTMSDAGKVDHFLFFDSTGMPSCALICTMELAR